MSDIISIKKLDDFSLEEIIKEASYRYREAISLSASTETEINNVAKKIDYILDLIRYLLKKSDSLIDLIDEFNLNDISVIDAYISLLNFNGDIYYDKEEYDKALEYFNEAKKVVDIYSTGVILTSEYSGKSYNIEIKIQIGLCYLHLGEIDTGFFIVKSLYEDNYNFISGLHYSFKEKLIKANDILKENNIDYRFDFTENQKTIIREKIIIRKGHEQ